MRYNNNKNAGDFGFINNVSSIIDYTNQASKPGYKSYNSGVELVSEVILGLICGGLNIIGTLSNPHYDCYHHNH